MTKEIEFGIQKQIENKWVPYAIRCIIETEEDAIRIAKKFGSNFRAVAYITTTKILRAKPIRTAEL